MSVVDGVEESKAKGDGGNAVGSLAADGRSTAAIATTLVPELMTRKRAARVLELLGSTCSLSTAPHPILTITRLRLALYH